MQELMLFLKRCRGLLDAPSITAAPKQDLQSRRRARVQNVMNLVINGYNAALDTEPAVLTQQLAGMNTFEKAVLYEGAFMALASMDLASSPDLARVSALNGFDPSLVKSMFQGLGGAIAKLSIPVEFYPVEVKQSWGWLAISGYGGHAGYFHWTRYIDQQEIPTGISGLALKAFDQGIGTSIWFVAACEPKLIMELIAKFPESRKADLWNGLGLVVGVWGMEDHKDLLRLMNGAKKYRTYFQSGVALGVWLRFQNKDITDFAEGASSLICGAPVDYIDAVVSEQLLEFGGAPKDSIDFLKWKSNVTSIFERN